MSLSSAAVAQAAALPSLGLLPPPALAHRSVVIVAAGGRDLVWPRERIASALLQRSGGRSVHLLLHGGARGADRAIGRAAHQLGWRVQSLAADWRRYGRSAGPIRNRRLLQQALVEAQELTTAIGQLAEQLEADDPERRALALAELEAALLAEEGNKQALAAKADATCWVIEHLRGQAAYRQQQAKRLADLARSDAGRADALEESLIFVLTQLQPAATRFSFPDHELTSRKSQAVVIDDEEALDAEWLTFSTTSKPDKNAIKEALKAGRQITGAQLLNRRSWRIH
jgi:hypothetical protein